MGEGWKRRLLYGSLALGRELCYVGGVKFEIESHGRNKYRNLSCLDMELNECTNGLRIIHR